MSTDRGEASVSGIVLAVALAACACAQPVPFDLVILGGTVIDGTGGPSRTADVAIRGKRIVAIGDLSSAVSRTTLDATGLVVAPGWIDMHSHADLILVSDETTQRQLLGAKIAQGVTTVIVGNCGLGVVPASAAAAEVLSGVNGWMTPVGSTVGAMTVAEYLERLESDGIILNAGTFVPHGPVRMTEMGLAPGSPSADESVRLRSAVERGLADGAFGLTAGLIYPPGMYSSTTELADLAEVVAAADGLFAIHVRGSSETLLDATHELIEIGRLSGARMHHSHLEAVGEKVWPRIGEVLALEDAARFEGLSISHDVFPYTRAATMMSAIYPPWALEGGVPALLDRLADPESRELLRGELRDRVPEWPPWQPGGWPHNLVGAVGWDGIFVASVGAEGASPMVGRSLAEIARSDGRDPFDVVADLMLTERGQVGQLVAEVSGDGNRLEGLRSILAHPSAAVISDAEDYGRGVPHPAHAGAFVRALRWNRERPLLPIEELVHRMTLYPASLVGIADRGVLRSGAYADLVVFDPDRVGDRATWRAPRQTAAGIRWVVINGEIVASAGLHHGGRVGNVLRR
jgi:N-acyl-D-aspartate/D-glutamate deacylase